MMDDPQPNSTRLGVFGGTFDPVHYGHLLLAESCREQCDLDEVWLLPAASAPHKRRKNTASATHRFQMLRLAISGHSSLNVSDLEIQRGGVSYTVDTLAEIQRQRPAAELFFLMGADSMEDLPHWRQPQRICELAVPVAVRRAGSREPRYELLEQLVTAERLDRFRRFQVTMPIIELTSTEIRQRVARGKSIRYRTPRAVEQYIRHQRLYTQGGASTASGRFADVE